MLGAGRLWIRHLLKLYNGNCDHALQSDTKSSSATKVRPLPLFAALWLVVFHCLLLHVTASISYSINCRQLRLGGICLSQKEWFMSIAPNTKVVKQLSLFNMKCVCNCLLTVVGRAGLGQIWTIWRNRATRLLRPALILGIRKWELVWNFYTYTVKRKYKVINWSLHSSWMLRSVDL
jgi:hypothetical protein